MKIEKDPYGNRLTCNRDMRLRFHNTIVMSKKGTPCLINAEDTDGKLTPRVSPYDTKRQRFSHSQSGYIHISNFETNKFDLGLVKFGADVCFLSRVPVRRYKQGLNSSNVGATLLRDGYTFAPRYEQIAQCLIFEAPSLKEQREQNCDEIILNKELALIRKKDELFRVFCGVEEIGTYNFSTNSLKMYHDGLFSVYSEQLLNAGLY